MRKYTGIIIIINARSREVLVSIIPWYTALARPLVFVKPARRAPFSLDHCACTAPVSSITVLDTEVSGQRTRAGLKIKKQNNNKNKNKPPSTKNGSGVHYCYQSINSGTLTLKLVAIL